MEAERGKGVRMLNYRARRGSTGRDSDWIGG
jgi:hypothetical protein